MQPGIVDVAIATGCTDREVCAKFRLPEFDHVWFWVQVRKGPDLGLGLQHQTDRFGSTPREADEHERNQVFLRCYSTTDPNIDAEIFVIVRETLPATETLVHLLATVEFLRPQVLIPTLVRLLESLQAAGRQPFRIPDAMQAECSAPQGRNKPA